jgi:hypothetical protein
MALAAALPKRVRNHANDFNFGVVLAQHQGAAEHGAVRRNAAGERLAHQSHGWIAAPVLRAEQAACSQRNAEDLQSVVRGVTSLDGERPINGAKVAALQADGRVDPIVRRYRG